MEIPDHIDALRRQGDLLTTAAERAGLDAPVLPCPAWRVKDLPVPTRPTSHARLPANSARQVCASVSDGS